MKISALLLTKNEEDIIEEALQQLDFVDEIIILDQNSTDKTVQIAKKYSSNITNTNIEDFSKRRNMLAQSASGDWLLYIDADEILNEENVKEIKHAIESSEHSAYFFARRNNVLGKVLRHGGWWPDYVPRLFKKSDFISWEGEVHESPKYKGTSGNLKNPLTHKTARDIRTMLEKSSKWAHIEADLYFKANAPRVTILKSLKFSISEFISRYFLKLGFLDGGVGLIASLYQSLHRLMILAFLWELQNNANESFQKVKNEQ